MRDLLDDLVRWHADGRRVALGRVVATEGSAPREPGAAMAVRDDGRVIGSVSGGCVESAVVDEALAVLEGRRPPRVVRFGYSDDDAFAVGLTCGGVVHVFVEPLPGEHVGPLAAAVAAGTPVALVTALAGPTPGATVLVPADGEPVGTLGDPDLDRVVAADAAAATETGQVVVRHYGPHGEARMSDWEVLLQPFTPPPRLVIFGAVDFTAALARVGALLGYRVTVCDARAAFATPARFPMADEVVVDWPDRLLERIGPDLGPRDAVCVLTHDPRFDVPAVQAALRTRVGYLGAMGSRRTTEERAARLRAAGVDAQALSRLHAPIGLDLGARTPEEVAVAVAAEIIAARRGRRVVRPLRDTDGPIHAPRSSTH